MFAPALLAISILGQPEPPSADARAAVEKAIPRIEASLAEYARNRDCFACHHQGVGLLALTTAERRGFKVDRDLIRDQAAFTATDVRNSMDAYKRGSGQGGGATAPATPCGPSTSAATSPTRRPPPSRRSSWAATARAGDPPPAARLPNRAPSPPLMSL